MQTQDLSCTTSNSFLVPRDLRVCSLRAPKEQRWTTCGHGLRVPTSYDRIMHLIRGGGGWRCRL